MSDFDAALALLDGGKKTFSAGGSYGTPSSVLDGLQKTESSGNAYAINKQTKAMGPYQFTPDTVAMLHKQGVKFDPFNPTEARAAADWYLSNLKDKNGGDLNKALASYGGFVTKDPSGYQSKVTGTTAPKSDFDAALSLLEAPKVQPAQPAADNIGGGRGVMPASAYAKSPVMVASKKSNLPPMAAEQGSDPGAALLVNQLTGLGSSIVGGWKGLATLASGGSADDAANAVTKYQQEHTYHPQEGTRSDAYVKAFGSGYNPLTWVGKAGDWAGEKSADAAHYMGASPEVSGAIGAGVNTAINAAPLVMGWKSRNEPVKPMASMAPVSEAEAQASIAPRPQQIRIEPTLENNPSSALSDTAPKPAPASVPAQSTTAQPAPIQPAPKPSQVFSDPVQEVPSGAKVLPKDTQAARAQILGDIGLQDARKSAITGDTKAAATDYQMSKLDGPAGNQMKNVLDAERQALEGHAENIVRSTGGTSGLDQSTLYARGNTILAPLDGLRQWFDKHTSALYKEADARAQGVPTQLGGFKDVLSDDSMLTNSDRVHLRDGLNSYVKKLRIGGEDGSIAGSAQQAETIRKYLNENWSPANSKFVGALKDALDEDVTKAAGDDVYAEARRMRTLRGQTLDNPNGIAKLVDADGINRSVPVEKIPDAVTGMPVDQLNHVIETLRNVPEELKPQADAAIAEIQAHFANNVSSTGSKFAGQWNAKGVNKYLQGNGEKMGLVMTPDQIKAFDTLNQAGHILGKDQSYPGAAAQGHNLIRSGAMGAVQSGSAAIGAALGGPIGAGVGNLVGSKAAQAMSDRAALNNVKGRVTKLSDFAAPAKGK